jgi:hypothetical protein
VDIITLLAIIFLIVGVILLLAGYLVPTVPPGAVNAGWGLLLIGVVLIVVVILVGALDGASLHSGHD